MAFCDNHKGEKPLKKVRLSLAEQKAWKKLGQLHKSLIFSIAKVIYLEVLVANEFATEAAHDKEVLKGRNYLDKYKKEKETFWYSVTQAHGFENEKHHLHISGSGKELICFNKK